MVVLQPPLIERLRVLRYWRGRCTDDMGKERVENERCLVGEVLEVLLHVAVEDGEEAEMVVLERHEVRDVERPDRVRPFVTFLESHPAFATEREGLQT